MVLEASRLQVTKKTLNFPKQFGFLASLGRFGTPFGREVGATGVPISSMLAPGCLKMLKNEVPEGIPEKTLFFDGILIGKCEVSKMLNSPKCFIYKHLGGFRCPGRNYEFDGN